MFVGKEDFKIAFRNECIDVAGKPLEMCSDLDKYQVLVSLIKSQASKVRTETLERVRESKEKEVYYFSIPAWRSLERIWTASVPWNGTRDLATAAWAAWPPALWIPWHFWACLEAAWGSATDLACSSKRL